MTSSIEEHFSQLEDPRVEGNQPHGFVDILILVICAVSSGAEGWEAIEQFGKAKLQWLRQFAPLARCPLSRLYCQRHLTALGEGISSVFCQLDRSDQAGQRG